MWLRAWLRRLIGWEDVGASLKAMRDHCVNLENLIEAQGKEIAELKGIQFRRETKQKAFQVSDWEQVQAAYAADPANYKEDA